MANMIDEKVSMLMDDELSEHEWQHVIETMKVDDNVKFCWENYHLISETLRNNLPRTIDPQLSNRISKALEQEPQHHRIPHKTRKPVTSASPFSYKAITSYALAASITVVAVVGLLFYNQKPEIQIETQQVAATPNLTRTVKVDEQTMLIVPAEDEQQNSELAQWQGPSRDIDPEIYDYLVNHNEYAVTAPVHNGMLPYARLVGYASEE